MQSERSLIPTPMPVRRHARSGNRGLALTALCLAVLLVVMDNTIVNVAIPTMSDALNASSTDLQWVVDAYTLSFAALLLPAGKLSDRWGRRRILLVGLAGFAVVSAATAFSWALWQLVTLRVVLGVCAALIYPATLSSIIVIFEGSRYRSLAVGLWAATSGVGIALGPIIGGVLLEHYAWNSIFWVCSVIGVVALACIAVAVPEVRAYRSERFDFPGTVLSVAGVGLLVWAIIERPTYGWLSWQVIGGICAALIILAVFAAVEGHTHAPLIDVGCSEGPRSRAAPARSASHSSACSASSSSPPNGSRHCVDTPHCRRRSRRCPSRWSWRRSPRSPRNWRNVSDTGRSSRRDCCSCRRACSWSRVSTPIAATGSWSYPPWP